MTHKSLRNTVGIASLTALALTMVACGGSSSSTPATPVAVNLAPTGVTVSGSSAGKVGHTQIFNLSATDPDGDSAAISYTLTPAVAGASISGKVLTFTPTVTGTAVLTVTATDVKGATATGTTAVLVAANQAPTFTAASTVNIGAGATAQSFVVGNATDADGDNVTYSLAAGGPAWVTFNATTRTLTVAPTGAVVAGAYTVTVNATDGFTGGTASQTITINVGALPAGTITGYPSNTTVIYRGLPFNFQFSAGSPLAGDTIVGYALDNGAGGAAPVNSAVTAGGLFTWTPSATIALGDPVFFGVTATFASGVKAYQTFQLTPSQTNNAPVWNNGVDLVTPVASSYQKPTKLNNTNDGTLATTYGAVLSWAGSTANSYTVPLTGINTTDIDITPTTDAVTFTITKAVIVGDGTATNVTAQITAAGGSLSFAAGALTPNTYAFGTLTFVAPTTGTVAVGAVKLGQAVGAATNFTVGTTGNLKVTITATDKGGLTSTHVVEIPVRQNSAPRVDAVVAAGGAALTSGDDYSVVGPDQLASAAPAFGIANTWTLNVGAAAPVQREVNDPETDTITQISLTNVKVNGLADTRFAAAATPAAAPTKLVVSGPSFTAADSRKPYSFDVVAGDKFGAVSKVVTFSGLINGTVAGAEVATWVSDDTDNVVTPYDFTGASTVTINPYYPTGIPANVKKFNTDLGVPVNYVFTGDADGNFSINSVPGGVYYAKTNSTLALPTNWFAYSNSNSLNLSNADAGRVSPLAAFDPTAPNTAASTAVASLATNVLSTHFGLVSVFSMTNDAFQMINTNLGLVAYFSGNVSTSTFPGAWPFGDTSTWNTTNNLADLDFAVRYFEGANGVNSATPLASQTLGDTLMFGRMTAASGTDANGNAAATNYWKLARVATPSPTVDMAAAGTTTQPSSNFGDGTTAGQDIAMGKSVKTAITRSAFNANLQALSGVGIPVATASPALYSNDFFKVSAYPHGTANGAIEPGVPTLFQLADLSLTQASGKKDVDFGTMTYGNPFAGSTDVASYNYMYNVPVTASVITGGGVAKLSAGLMTTAIPTAAVAPTVTPVKNLVVSAGVVAGADTWVNGYVNTGSDPDGSAVGSLPVTTAAAVASNGQKTVQWDAQTGVSGYIVTVYNVNAAAADQAAFDALVPVATIHTSQNSVMFPVSVLPAGQKYMFKIRTVKMAGVDFNTAPFAKAFPYEWAEAISGAIQF